MSSTKPQTIIVDGVKLTLVVQRKQVKNVNARLRDSVLSISAPLDAPQALLDDLIPDMARQLVRRARAREVNAEQDAVMVAHRVAARFPNKPEIADVQFVTTQKKRWGTYSPTTGAIRLHAALREMPLWVLEAVVAHELAHVIHQDHSPAFWELLDKVCPEHDRATIFLAGVTWLARSWDEMPPVERALLQRTTSYEEE